MTERKTRAERTADTRNRVVEKARDLFVLQGFAGTTTREVAAAAGVTERTLFNIVPSKGDLLRQVVLTYVYGQDEGPLLDRNDLRPVLDSRSGQELLYTFAQWVRDLHERSSALAEVVRAASSVDSGAAAIWAHGNLRQVTDCRDIIFLVRRRGWLPARVVLQQAAESLAVLAGHETYWRLVAELKWSAEQYLEWLHRHIQMELDRVPAVQTSVGQGSVGGSGSGPGMTPTPRS